MVTLTGPGSEQAPGVAGHAVARVRVAVLRLAVGERARAARAARERVGGGRLGVGARARDGTRAVRRHLVPVALLAEGADGGERGERPGGAGRGGQRAAARAARQLVGRRQRVRGARAPPRRRREHQHRHHDGPADGRAGRDRDFVHVGGGRGHGAHLAALPVRHALGAHVHLLQGDHAHHDAFLHTRNQICRS